MRHESHATGAALHKLRQKSTGLVFERWGPGARDYVAGGDFEFVTEDAPWIREILKAKSREELNALAGFLPGGGGRYSNDERRYVEDTLIRLSMAPLQ